MTPGLGHVSPFEPHRIISGIAETEVMPGAAVFQGSGARQVRAAPGALFRGVAVVSDGMVAPDGATFATRYHLFNSVAVLVSGVVGVLSALPVKAGNAAYVSLETGRFTNDPAGNVALRGTFDAASSPLGSLASGWPAVLRLI